MMLVRREYTPIERTRHEQCDASALPPIDDRTISVRADEATRLKCDVRTSLENDVATA